jgi:hypothetical protein
MSEEEMKAYGYSLCYVILGAILVLSVFILAMTIEV